MTTNHVPTWVHMADVPPGTDEPSCTRSIPCPAHGRDEPHVTPVGAWLLIAGLILAVIVAVVGVLVSR